VVTKDQRDRKSGELVNLYGETIQLCRSVGFRLEQHIVALLCAIDEDSGGVKPRTSHWQRLAVRKAKEQGRVVVVGQFEDVAVFRKVLASQAVDKGSPRTATARNPCLA